MVTVWLDEITPCLKDSLTGELVDTEVLQIQEPVSLKSITRETDGIFNGTRLLRIARYLL